MRFLDHLIDSIRNAAAYNRMYEISPACILWTDKDREWQPVIDILRNEIPELFILGEYQSEKRTGPAIWLRCVLSNVIEASVIPAGTIPVIYLRPGLGCLSRRQRRASGLYRIEVNGPSRAKNSERCPGTAVVLS